MTMNTSNPSRHISSATKPSTEPALIVGLGNPGDEYKNTRHNIGYMVIEALADNTRPMPSNLLLNKRSQAMIAETRLGDRRVILAQPLTFMNLSGQSINTLARYNSIKPANIIVIHDDLDLPLGEIRLKLGGGEGGHNGLRSTTQMLGTRDYLRVRCGIGRPPGRMDPAAYVLKPFSALDRQELPFMIDKAAHAVELLLRSGLTSAQNEIHSKK